MHTTHLETNIAGSRAGAHHRRQRRTAHTATAATAVLALAALSGAVPAHAADARDYDPRTPLSFEWGDGTQITGEWLNATDEATTLRASALKNRHHGTVATDSLAASLPDGTPVVSRNGLPYTVDAQGKTHPYFPGKPATQPGALLQSDGDAVWRVNEATGNVTVFRGPDRAVTTARLATTTRHTAVTDTHLYFDRFNNSIDDWQVVAQNLDTGNRQVVASHVLNPFVVDGKLGVVKIARSGSKDAWGVRPIQGLKIVDGAWLVRPHGAWPSDDVPNDSSLNEQPIPSVKGSIVNIPILEDNSTRGQTVIDLKRHKAWRVSFGGNSSWNHQSGDSVAAWQITNTTDPGGPDGLSHSLILDTRTSTLNKVVVDRGLVSWNLNDRGLSYSYRNSDTRDTYTTGRLR